MSEVSVNTKSQNVSKAPPMAPLDSTKGSGVHNESQDFEFPNLFKGLSENSAAHATESWQIIRAANEKLTSTMEGACRVAVKESMDYATHLAEMAQTNLTAASELASALLAAKSPSDIVDISGRHARKQLEVIAEQNRKLWTLGQRVSASVMGPINDSVPAKSDRKK